MHMNMFVCVFICICVDYSDFGRKTIIDRLGIGQMVTCTYPSPCSFIWPSIKKENIVDSLCT